MPLREDAGQVVDTIIVGVASKGISSNSPFSPVVQSAAITGSEQSEYKIHGRVRREDGLVAFVRQPVSGSMLFEMESQTTVGHFSGFYHFGSPRNLAF